MLGINRALGLRPQASLGILPAGRQLGPTAASRGFASYRSQAPSKWTRRLLIGVPTLGVLTFVVPCTPSRRQPPVVRNREGPAHAGGDNLWRLCRGQRETAEKFFQTGIHLYVKYHDEFSEHQSRSTSNVLAGLDLSRGVRLAPAPGSTHAQKSVLAKPLARFDDLMSLQAIRDERRRGRGEGYDVSFYQ
ncbi:hypothetical protein ON010_g18591 [Phytophthora cinnamomi]|nr:hypothetical protein ON010_g18591 [Phytophthora cinnamomi]